MRSGAGCARPCSSSWAMVLGSHRVAADHTHQQGAAGFGRQVKDPPADRFQGTGDPFPQPGGGEHPRKDSGRGAGRGSPGWHQEARTCLRGPPSAVVLAEWVSSPAPMSSTPEGPGCPEQGLERCRGSRAAACIFGCRHTESLQSVACQVILFSPGPYNHTKGR